jgi:hypothetical protein
MKIEFIIKECGEKWGKRVNKDMTDRINGASVGASGRN